MTDARGFSSQISREFDSSLEELRLVLRRVSLDALTRIVKKTPVDTGRARGNWFVQIDEAGIEVSDDVDKSGSVTVAKGAAALSTYAKKKNFPPIVIYNNLPYILRLEHGHSKQAPFGMVSTTLAELESSI